MIKLTDIRHPEHSDNYANWCKYADAYIAGHQFVNDYVEEF